jgi:hypothetical protein
MAFSATETKKIIAAQQDGTSQLWERVFLRVAFSFENFCGISTQQAPSCPAGVFLPPRCADSLPNRPTGLDAFSKWVPVREQ